jgi:hypothetical protein
MTILKNATFFIYLPEEIVESIYKVANIKKEIQTYFKHNVMPLVDPTIRFVSNKKCTSCYMLNCSDITSTISLKDNKYNSKRCVLCLHCVKRYYIVSAHSAHIQKIAPYKMLLICATEAWIEKSYFIEPEEFDNIKLKNEVLRQIKRLL